MSETAIETSIKILIPQKDKNEISCGKCLELFKTKKELKNHICKPHACEQCGQRFSKKIHVGTHRRFFHIPKQFTCEEEGCGKSFKRKSDLDQHSLAHIDYKPFRCKLCGKRFKALNHFKVHKRVHSTDATFASQVDWENESSHSESDEEAHPERKYRVFTCDICGKHFKRNCYMKRHIKSHAKHFVCVTCVPVVNFKTVSEREEHYKTVHLGRPFKCGECDRSFTQKSFVKRHLKEVHEKKIDEEKKDSDDWTP